MPDTHEWSQAAVASEREARRVDAASRLRRIQFERDPSLLAGRKGAHVSLTEGYRRHTGPEFHTGGMRGSNASSYVICGKARQRHGPEFRHTRACGGSKPAGSVACIRAPKARLVFEEASLVHVLVEHIIVLLPHPLPAAPRRDEVEASSSMSDVRRYTTAQRPEFGHTMRHGSKPAGFSA